MTPCLTLTGRMIEILEHMNENWDYLVGNELAEQFDNSEEDAEKVYLEYQKIIDTLIREELGRNGFVVPLGSRLE